MLQAAGRGSTPLGLILFRPGSFLAILSLSLIAFRLFSTPDGNTRVKGSFLYICVGEA